MQRESHLEQRKSTLGTALGADEEFTLGSADGEAEESEHGDVLCGAVITVDQSVLELKMVID